MSGLFDNTKSMLICCLLYVYYVLIEYNDLLNNCLSAWVYFENLQKLLLHIYVLNMT